MKIVYTHAVAAGGAALPAQAYPRTEDWGVLVLSYCLGDFLRQSVMQLLPTLQATFDGHEGLTTGGIIQLKEFPPLRPIDLHSPEAIMPTHRITCRRCNSASGQHKPWCNR